MCPQHSRNENQPSHYGPQRGNVPLAKMREAHSEQIHRMGILCPQKVSFVQLLVFICVIFSFDSANGQLANKQGNKQYDCKNRILTNEAANDEGPNEGIFIEERNLNS